MSQIKLTFNQVLTELEKIKGDKNIADCVLTMKQGDVIFSPGIVQEKSKLTSLYKLRLNIKRKMQMDKITSEELDDWDKAVNILNGYECQMANLNVISTNERGYFLFWNNETKKLISSFWLRKKQTLEFSEKNNDLIIERGNTVSAIMYSKGIKVKEWKTEK